MTAAAKQQEQDPVSAEYARAVKTQKRAAATRGRAKRRAELAKLFAEEVADMQRLHKESFEDAVDRLMAEQDELDRHVCQILDFAQVAD